ncbi:MAG: hypothetical protein PHP57_01670 [Sideroxydans sp.]|nr:hypothetical protein [Sideroxydans sp.]
MLKTMLAVATVGTMAIAMSTMVHAKDVSAQQAGVEYAREAVSKAEAVYVVNAQRLSETEKKYADVQKQLAEDKKQAELSKLALDQAKIKLDSAQLILDKAWKQQ